MPRVSVITPVFNGERYVEGAVRSIQAQTIEDWEMIIVDDGSTDQTWKILSALRDARIRIVHKGNGGAASARNVALDMAIAKYVIFLDSDDILLPDALATLSGFLDRHCDYAVVYSDGYIADADLTPLMMLSEVRPYVATGWILESLIRSQNIIAVPACTLVRRECLEKNAVRFDHDLAPSEDYFFWVELARHAQFGYLDRVTCMYRVHGANITSQTCAHAWRRDLLNGHIKLMTAEWFGQLDIETRRRFFYRLLIDLAGPCPDLQRELLDSPQFGMLPAGTRGELLRMIASSDLLACKHIEWAAECLQKARDLNSEDSIGFLLLMLFRINPLLAIAALRVWRVTKNNASRILSFRQRKVKSVPRSLLPR